MKLQPRDAPRYFARPEPERTGLLIFGADAMRVALRRQEVVAALLGPGGEDEMRLTRIAAADLRKDKALLADAIKAQGFFPGPRVALLEEATDGLAKIVAAALEDWRAGDAQLVVTAGSLTPRSALRKLFEAHPNAYATGIYDDPPSREEVEAVMKAHGLGPVSTEGMAEIMALSRMLDPGDFRQTIEKLALYTLGQAEPVGPGDVAAVSPSTQDAEQDTLFMAVAEGRAREVGPLLRRLEAQGAAPVSLCIGAVRHFRVLHAAHAHPEGPAKGIARMRPPVHFKRRDRMVRQAQAWGGARLDQALDMLVETDLALRSSGQAPQMALMERTLIRLAMLGGR